MLASSLPQHVAIIMDGNGRWAKNRGQLRIFGHKAGVVSVRRAINFAINNNFNVLTLYAFSSENWNRPEFEVQALMKLFMHVLNNEINNLNKYNIRLKIIGDKDRFHLKLRNCIKFSEELTNHNTGLILNIAANYGGRWDIIQGIKQIVAQVQQGIINPKEINENTLCKYVSMYGLAPVDLVIRTGGEHRISNFLLWQIAYSELFFTDVLWPDFNDSVFKKALDHFSKCKRRFGKNISNKN